MRSFHSQRQELKSTKSYLVPIAVSTGTVFAGYQYIYKERWKIAKSEGDSLIGDLQVMSCYLKFRTKLILRTLTAIVIFYIVVAFSQRTLV